LLIYAILGVDTLENHNCVSSRSYTVRSTNCEPQGQLQKSKYKRGASINHNSQQIYNGGHGLQTIHESSNGYNQSEATQEDEFFDHNCSKMDQQGARGSTHSNAENLIISNAAVKGDSNLSVWKESSEYKPEFHGEDVACNVHHWSKAIDNEELNNMEACTDNSRYVRFVGKANKSAMLLSQLHLPRVTVSLSIFISVSY